MIVLTITSAKNLNTIKEEFNAVFPFLKLEFFKHKHGIKDASPKRDLFESNLSLNTLPKKYLDGFIHISEDMPVSKLEQLFLDQFGLSVQVFRKSGNSWLETSFTDDWTLKRQNDAGNELSQFTREQRSA